LENVIFAWNILKAVLGLGFVIFLHELGHFLLAKWNGVKVERFSIGFGPTLASFRKGVGLRVGTGSRAPGPKDPLSWGETEYVLAALPLGGYVKMLGESVEEPAEGEERSSDPRAYNNKSVFARMQIITAGVIMNLILGLACFTFVYSRGLLDRPALIGAVMPGSPAYKAGLRAGDEIIAIDGRRDVGYKDLLSRVSLSGAGQKVRFLIRHPGSEAEQPYDIEPLRDPSGLTPTIGMMSAQGLDLQPGQPFKALPGQEMPSGVTNPGFEGDDKVVAVGPVGGPLEPVADHLDYVRKLEKLRDRPVVVQVERKKAEGAKAAARASVVVPPHQMLDFGLRLTPGPVLAIRPGSPAEKAGIKEGDRIVAVGGDADFDPMRLPDLARASADQPLTIVVERAEPGKAATRLDLTVTPDASPAWVESFDPYGRLVPLDVPGLGLALTIEPKVRSVADGSPAAKAGVKPGETIRSIILTARKKEGEKSRSKSITVKLDGPISGWPMAFVAIQEIAMESVELTTDRAEKPFPITPEVDAGSRRYHALRGLGFQHLIRELPPLKLADAFNRGFEETVENVTGIFQIFRGLYQGRVGGDAFGGVLSIGQIAYTASSMGWTPFIHFLGVLSINLAVLNFLPIPPLDGGQFMILTAEKVRGKPLPEPALNALTFAGLAFVLGLIVLVNGKDIFRLIQGYFF